MHGYISVLTFDQGLRPSIMVPAGDNLKSLKCTYGKINDRQKSVNFSAFHRAQNGMASTKRSALK